MELPLRLRQAVDGALQGVAISELAAATKVLSHRYRNEVRDGRLHIADDKLALAYIATRMPATYAAIHKSLAALAERQPDFAPRTALDVGAGPGTVMWAASDIWPDLQSATLLEASPAIRAVGEKLAAASNLAHIDWRHTDITRDAERLAPSDLVTLAYVLDELSAEQRNKLVDRLWSLTSGALVIVEPGTTAGWKRILDARARLIAAGANILAPCTHALTCPIVEPDWCHFAARVARSRVHRLAKEAEVPWEDEKFIYLAASRTAAQPLRARILAPTEAATGRVRLKLCRQDGVAESRLVTRREGDAFKSARRSDWGDAFDF
ncbi:MAG: small ribosomal subunit Rsm22 family protein [Hyphomonadaceae bacterium]|nr:small ribosomal subunit Rsm22 family protein [Hyphomonadaceae bacterium]